MKYEPALDGLRAIAIGSVVLIHAFPLNFPGGWAGVDAFFVLSGFLITKILSEELGTRHRIGFRNFYAKRFLRLVPAFTLLLLFVLARAFIGMAPMSESLPAVAISAVYMMNWNRAFDWFPQSLLGHTWSLSIEEQFYLVWPICLAFIIKRRPLAWMFCTVLIITIWRTYLVLSGADLDRTYNGFDTHADALFIGCGLALLDVRPGVGTLARRFWPVPVGLFAAILLFLDNRVVWVQILGVSAAAGCSAWLVLLCINDGFLKRVLSRRAFTYTGKISYGWYLWHWPVLLIGAPLVHHTRLGIICVLITSYLIAALSFQFVESPFLRIKASVRTRNPRFEGTDSGILGRAESS